MKKQIKTVKELKEFLVNVPDDAELDVLYDDGWAHYDKPYFTLYQDEKKNVLIIGEY